MENKINCKYCGTIVFDSDRYCPSCGAPFETNEEKNEETFGSWFKEIQKFDAESMKEYDGITDLKRFK
jgi:uncharacterized OB-fold protein